MASSPAASLDGEVAEQSSAEEARCDEETQYDEETQCDEEAQYDEEAMCTAFREPSQGVSLLWPSQRSLPV